jgi:hypothetical protein
MDLPCKVSAVFSRIYDQVDVMGHQAICVNLSAQICFPLARIVQVIRIVRIRCKYDLPVVAALDDVVRITHYNDACCSWHAQPLTKYLHLAK